MEIKEEELYEPVKKYFEKRGFKIKGEVVNCDVAGVKDDILLVVELKKNFNLKLVYQAMERQKLTDYIYVAIPRPKNFKKKEVKYMIELLKKLKIGLLVVSFGEKRKMVQTVLEPIINETSKKSSSYKKNKVLYELNERTNDFNIGGKNKTKIITAYREKSIEIACFLEIFEKAKGLELKKLGCDKNATSIMRNNYYGWFLKIDKGIYSLSEDGKNYLNSNEFSEIIEFYRKEAKEKCLKYQEMKNVGVEVAKNINLATKEMMKKN